MRFDCVGIVTLEEDIIRLWKLHGWKVVEEKVKGNVWIIKAELMRKKKR